VRQRQYNAAIAGLIGIAPQDEIEGMIAAQLIATHNATMECYRRAMIGEQTLEGRRDNLNQANKLSRTYATLIEALNRHRGKGQQKVTVEHVDVHAGGQAVVGVVESPGGTLAPGRARLVTSPAPTGSPTLTITIGIVLVAFLAANDACVILWRPPSRAGRQKWAGAQAPASSGTSVAT
jgi:hypothetical protein